MSANGWLPIETAPKDGTKVDLWMKGPHNAGERQTDCWFEGGDWLQDFGRDGPLRAGNWFDDEATHWRLPPGPPTQENPNG